MLHFQKPFIILLVMTVIMSSTEYEEPYEYALRIAKTEIARSDHFIHVTYHTIENPKFLESISEHVIKAAKLALQALLEYELAYKRIDVYVDKLAPQIDLFEDEIYLRYRFAPDHLRLLKRLRRLEQSSKEAIIRFHRNDRYYFSSPRMETESISFDEVKVLFKFTKSFIAKVDTVIGNKEGR